MGQTKKLNWNEKIVVNLVLQKKKRKTVYLLWFFHQLQKRHSNKILQGKITVSSGGFFDQFFSFSVHSFINLSTMFFILIGGLHICSTYKRHTHTSGHHPYLLSHHAEKLENVFIENFLRKKKNYLLFDMGRLNR